MRKYGREHNENSCGDPLPPVAASEPAPSMADMETMKDSLAQLKTEIEALQRDVAELKGTVVDPSGGKPQTSPGGTPEPLPVEEPTPAADPSPVESEGGDIMLEPGQSLTVKASDTEHAPESTEPGDEGKSF